MDCSRNYTDQLIIVRGAGRRRFGIRREQPAKGRHGMYDTDQQRKQHEYHAHANERNAKPFTQ